MSTTTVTPTPNLDAGPGLLQKIDLLLEEPVPAFPDAEKYFPDTPFPQWSYAFWTVHAQACVTRARQPRRPDPSIPERAASWKWAPIPASAG